MLEKLITNLIALLNFSFKARGTLWSTLLIMQLSLRTKKINKKKQLNKQTQKQTKMNIIHLYS